MVAYGDLVFTIKEHCSNLKLGHENLRKAILDLHFSPKGAVLFSRADVTVDQNACEVSVRIRCLLAKIRMLAQPKVLAVVVQKVVCKTY